MGGIDTNEFLFEYIIGWVSSQIGKENIPVHSVAHRHPHTEVLSESLSGKGLGEGGPPVYRNCSTVSVFIKRVSYSECVSEAIMSSAPEESERCSGIRSRTTTVTETSRAMIIFSEGCIPG